MSDYRGILDYRGVGLERFHCIHNRTLAFSCDKDKQDEHTSESDNGAEDIETLHQTVVDITAKRAALPCDMHCKCSYMK